jgi:hypothetical protein
MTFHKLAVEVDVAAEAMRLFGSTMETFEVQVFFELFKV